MCEERLGLIALIAFAIWVYVALPLIYLPDSSLCQMISSIPTWAPVLTAIAATCAAAIAFRAFAVARQQLSVVVHNQKETTAKATFREFLKMCVEYPQFAYGKLPEAGATKDADQNDPAAKRAAEENKQKYEWFVAYFLWAAEEILEYAPGPWLANLQLHVEYHREYFEKNDDFRKNDFKTYTEKLQNFLREKIPSLPASDSAAGPPPPKT